MAIARVLSGLEKVAMALATTATFLAMLIIVLEIVFRRFGSYIPGSVEIITAYLIIAISYFPLMRLERTGGMISMDLINNMVGKKANRVLDVVVAVASIAVYVLLAVASYHYAIEKWEIQAYVLTSTYALMTWPAYFMLPLSFALAAAIVLLRLVSLHPATDSHFVKD
ncbi:MAG: TRAP transporter small permease subunit [Pigmentiphaga sp.]|nr:TRAP transporter small permease subunit [Pigmentiphaga sp.]